VVWEVVFWKPSPPSSLDHDKRIQQLQTDTDATIASKNAEIQSLTSLLEQARQQQQQQQQQGGEQPAAATVPMNDDVVAV
jgi:hypothetical protein